MILSALIHCRESAGYPFEMHRDKFSVEDVCRIVGIMQSKGLVSVTSDEFGDKYDDKLTIESEGSLIAGSGGWVAYLKSQKTEADWIDEVLRNAKESNISLCQDMPEEYHRAVERADTVFKLIEEVAVNSYSLTDKGDYALELGGFIEWKKVIRQERERQNNKSNNLTFNGPVTGSTINQDSLSDNFSNHNLTNTQSPAAASTPKKADQNTSSLNIWKRIYNWTNHNAISAIIVAIIIGLFGLLIKWLGWL